jgi:hypothetical protein
MNLLGEPWAIGDDPYAIVVKPDGLDAYLIEGDRVHTVNLSHGSYTTEFSPGGVDSISGFALVPGESRAILTDSDNGVYLISTTTWTTLDYEEIDANLFAESCDVAVAPDGALAIVANCADQSITFVTVQGTDLTIGVTIGVGGSAQSVAFTQTGQKAVVALGNTSQLKIVDVPNRLVSATVSTGLGLFPVRVRIANMGDWTDDGDGDTFFGGADCDDSSPYIYPDAPEILDGVDNQCPGDVGHGEIDEGMEVTGLVFTASDDPYVFCWDQLSGITGYEVGQANDALFSDTCVSQLVPPAACRDTDPVPAGEIRFYLVHAYGCFPGCVGGPWGQAFPGGDRTVSCSQYPPP